MDFSRFFIDRPIFAAVLSIVIFAAGLISIPILPIGEYPEMVFPSESTKTRWLLTGFKVKLFIIVFLSTANEDKSAERTLFAESVNFN